MVKSTIKGVPIPRRQTIGSAGYDFYSPVSLTVRPGEHVFIDTGIVLEDRDFEGLPHCAMLLVPRSSYGFKYGMRFDNAVGLIDMDYRDTIKASFTAEYEFKLEKGDRFMQGLFVPVLFSAVEEEPTDVRDGGVGSTGV